MHADSLDQLKKRDLHVHTPLCRHASGTMEDYILAALDAGLEEIGFLEHSEVGLNVGPMRLWLTPDELDQYWLLGRELADRYQGRIKVTLGVELGLTPGHLEQMHQVMELHPWDRIGLSYHRLLYGNPVFSNSFGGGQRDNPDSERRAVALQYYRELTDCLEAIRPFMVCHLDLPCKFMRCGEDPELRGAVLETLAAMKACGAHLEINTSGYYMIGRIFPAPWIVATAVDMGLELVLNSDSHDPSSLAQEFDRALRDVRLALDAGDSAA